MGVATRTNRTCSFCSSCGWCHTICVIIPRAACAPKLMQERRVVTFELCWFDKLDEKKSNRVDAVRVETEFETKDHSLFLRWPISKDQWKSIGLALIRLGRLSDTPEAGQLPDQISTSEQVLRLTPMKAWRWFVQVLSFPASCFYFVVFTEQVLQY